ncbi:tRNA pseudouridine(55) synthase TruB [Roseateles amylovorans]|jgi:tRNA pseudouridine55 synthase|uniref:tRNA pseudouridine synthase B n=1 Tax=Roseateles amylovorans TaxID=2978473 RepID=A0ABY6ATN6_9BURK|nr:tRNA pseudouridine(55) synthase TruB [Roseateles amylovorans]UXH76589.1 tRNA pseudouridine(55) synthase TruB [Roseateles amylovorans]
MSAVAPRPKIVKRAVHGVLMLDKPLGLTSNDALQKAKRLFRAEKAGHTGTLDPLATGLLPLTFGAATKFSQVSLEADKGYRATLRLGITTTTGDGEGEILERRDEIARSIDLSAIQSACVPFRGLISQLPPMYSALKHQGRALYELAREGVTVERQPRQVTIHALDIVDWQADELLLILDVRCSKGTYIRTLAEDIGSQLGCGAHLAGLRRTSSGPVRVEQAVTLEQLEALDEPARLALLKAPDSLLGEWPEVELSNDEAGRFLSGMRRRVALADMPQVRVYGQTPHAFLGSGHVAGGELIADRLLSPTEIASMLVQAA